MGVVTALAAVGTALGASAATAAATGALAVGSVAAGGISAAAKGSAARKAKKSDQAFQADENQKARDHDLAMKQKEIDRYKNAIAAWSDYDTGAKPLVRRQPASAGPGLPSAAQPPQPGLLSTAYGPRSVPQEPEREW